MICYTPVVCTRNGSSSVLKEMWHAYNTSHTNNETDHHQSTTTTHGYIVNECMCVHIWFCVLYAYDYYFYKVHRNFTSLICVLKDPLYHFDVLCVFSLVYTGRILNWFGTNHVTKYIYTKVLLYYIRMGKHLYFSHFYWKNTICV